MSAVRFAHPPNVLMLHDERQLGLCFASNGRRSGIAVTMGGHAVKDTPPFLLDEADIVALRDMLTEWLAIEVIA